MASYPYRHTTRTHLELTRWALSRVVARRRGHTVRSILGGASEAGGEIGLHWLVWNILRNQLCPQSLLGKGQLCDSAVYESRLQGDCTKEIRLTGERGISRFAGTLSVWHCPPHACLWAEIIIVSAFLNSHLVVTEWLCCTRGVASAVGHTPGGLPIP